MVIRTEYRGQRYSLGCSDPLPAGFEIRLGGLNFQATGNGYLMRLTNREELRARRQDGSAPVAAARAVTMPTPARTDAAGPLAPRRHRRSRQHDDSRLDGGALSLRTALSNRSARRRDGLHRQRQHQHDDAQGSPWPPRSGCQGP
jgi:hypothetical protein